MPVYSGVCFFQFVCWDYSVTHLQNGNDKSKKAYSAAKDLDDQDLDEERAVSCISESSSRSNDANADTTRQVAYPNGQPSTKHLKACGNKYTFWSTKDFLRNQGLSCTIHQKK